MNNPAIQNDFSYYRRTKNRKRLDDIQNVTPQLNGEELEIPDDIANRMSLFYANPTPMLNAIANATTKFTKEVNRYTGICTYIFEMIGSTAICVGTSYGCTV